MTRTLSRFLLLLAFTCATVGIMFGIKASLFGLAVVIVAVFLFSLEPFTSAVVSIMCLIAIAVFVDPVVAAGSGIIVLVAGIAGIIILITKSSETAKRLKRTGNQDLDI